MPVDYNEADFNDVVKIFNKLKNEQYSLDNINLILDEIDLIASSKIYDFIKIEVEKNIINKNQLNYNFIVKDSDKFYVEKINILGNFNTIEEVIRNKLIVDEGDPFNELHFNKSINDLKSLGIFKSVDSSNNQWLLSKYKNSKYICGGETHRWNIFGAGYGTIGGVIGGGITEKNFLGKGITLDTNLQISNDGVKGSLTYAKPNFNYSDNTLFTSIKSTSEDNLSAYGYKITTAGISVGTRFEQYKNFYFSPELDFTQEDLNTNSSASNNLKKQEGSYSDFYFNYNLLYDNRDSSFNPTRGSVFSFSQDLPLISSDDEISNTFSYTKYKSLNDSKSMIGKISFYLNTVNSLGNNDARISKRAHVPYSRLRGFERGKVGPIDGNDYIGGNYVSAINLSTNLPAILSTLENIDFSYFIDFANVWGVDYDDTIDDSNQIRSSTGIALDYLSQLVH